MTDRLSGLARAVPGDDRPPERPGALLAPVGDLSKELGKYLRARRELLRPQDVGLRSIGRRRVPGLRREEVAELTGISREYYLRLEQGRGQLPSASVLGALAVALRLDSIGTAHLRTLAAPMPRPAPPDGVQEVPLSVVRLLDTWTDVPAYVQSAAADVLVANSMATALSPLCTPGTNLLRALFLVDPFKSVLLNREEVLARAVAGLQVEIGKEAGVGNPRRHTLVEELTATSEEFRLLWRRYDVSAAHRGVTVLDHAVVGRLELHYTRLSVPGTAGQSLVAHVAEPGSTSARALAGLMRHHES